MDVETEYLLCITNKILNLRLPSTGALPTTWAPLSLPSLNLEYALSVSHSEPSKRIQWIHFH